ncbi:RNA polymerase sigma subunit ECF family protein [Desulfosarcina alkanivorans]|uniref:RNA polymerase sigma subunit ECF family protein n=1 Tax=Desulfosarcina alkanivorans TaxID=571177 RepID=A0A5K7YTH9_9BACT|nr:sigma-70 family RNA polymerase sigma factor [Desulfosarcina alkanivorans]BBO67957.1 RNA polymerase sigma subunit ECF family protein [Desulfosarcina alkanivorans]
MILQRTHSRQSDAHLVRLVSEGNERAFRELLHRHQDAVYGFARRMLGDSQEAEDVTQDTFLRLYRASSRYRPEASLRTFLFRIAKNICIDYHRKKRPELMAQLPEIATEETPLDLLESAIEAGRLEKAIEALPANQRAALLLRHGEQMRYNQIAEVMELSVSAVESLLVRARRTLRRDLYT